MNAATLTEVLLRETNVLLYGPPGTGKTYLVQEVANRLSGGDPSSAIYVDTSQERRFLERRHAQRVEVFWVTFHQTYSYDDFVIGIRPESTSNGPLRLRPEPGVLLQAAAHAAEPNNSSLVVIDEINRGNASQIFGEFITIMEKEKRLADDGQSTPRTVAVTLPYAARGSSVEFEASGIQRRISNPFAMPSRVYALATMNSVDRSAAPLDAAIRRRFYVVNLPVDIRAIGICTRLRN